MLLQIFKYFSIMLKQQLIGLTLVLITTLVAACGNKKNADLAAANYYDMGDTVQLDEGQEVRYYKPKGWDLIIRFDSLVADSRCPKDANCIWEGNAEVALTLLASKKNTSFVLNTNKTMETERSFDQYKVKLIDVKPYPTNPANGEKPSTKHKTAQLQVYQ